MQTPQSIIHNAIASLFPSNIRTNPLMLTHSSSHELSDESGRLTLIYQVNEHFINQYDLTKQEDSDSFSAFDYMDTLANRIAPAILQAINTPEFEYDPSFKQIEIPNGLIYLFINQRSDSLSIQITDHSYYITFTASGQY